VEEFTGKPYEFGDITREVEQRRQQWVRDYLGEEAASNYQFGDLTKKFVKDLTGKDDYQVSANLSFISNLLEYCHCEPVLLIHIITCLFIFPSVRRYFEKSLQ